MPRLSRAESQASTRERLLDAARTIFVRDGYVRASLDAIADEAGFSKGAVYSNFEGKEALFLELLRRKFAEDQAHLEAMLAEVSDLQGLLAALEAYYSTRADVLDFTLVSAEFGTQVRTPSPHGDAYAALYADQRRQLGEHVASLLAREGGVLREPPEAVGAAFVALSVGLAVQRRVAPEAITPGLWGALVTGHLRRVVADVARR